MLKRTLISVIFISIYSISMGTANASEGSFFACGSEAPHSQGLAKIAPVRLVVYNMLGQEVAVLIDRVHKAGHHQVTWDASEMASGIYLVRLETGNFKEVRKAVLLR